VGLIAAKSVQILSLPCLLLLEKHDPGRKLKLNLLISEVVSQWVSDVGRIVLHSCPPWVVQERSTSKAHSIALVVELGEVLGDPLGTALGEALGDPLGETLGASLGEVDGELLGFALGIALGVELGEELGDALGIALGSTLGDPLGRATAEGLTEATCTG
jgi:hypothetical protein